MYMNRAGPVILLKYFNKGNTNKNFAYVYYTCLSDAIRAVEMFDQTLIYNSRLFVTLHKDNAFLKGPFPIRDSSRGRMLQSTTSGYYFGQNAIVYYPTNVVHPSNNGQCSAMGDPSSFHFSSFCAALPQNVFPPRVSYPSPIDRTVHTDSSRMNNEYDSDHSVQNVLTESTEQSSNSSIASSRTTDTAERTTTTTEQTAHTARPSRHRSAFA